MKHRCPVANPTAIQQFAKKKGLKFSSLKEKRIVTLEWLKENVAGKSVHAERCGRVLLSWQGLKNDVSHHHGHNVSKLLSFVAIEKIISQAKFIESVPDKRGNSDVKIHKLVSKVKIKRNVFDVFIYLRETNQTAIYDHILFLE